MPMYGNAQSGASFTSHQGSFGGMSHPMYSQNQSAFGEFGMPSMMSSTPAYNGGFYQDASGQLQPLSSQAPPAASSMDSMHPQSQHMVQVGHAILHVQQV